MIFLAEVLRAIAMVVFIFSSSFYLRHLERIKKQRKLSKSELTQYILIQIAFGLVAISLLVSIFAR